jgi:hypothetical protein
VDRQVQPDPEQLALPPGQAGGELTGICRGHVDLGVTEASFGRVGPSAGLEAGQLAAQALGGELGWDRLDVNGHVEATGVAGEGLQPSEADLPGIADNREAPAPPASHPQ